MRTRMLLAGLLLAAPALFGAAGEPVSIHSPGFPPSQMDPQGRLLEDWGQVAVRLIGQAVLDGSVATEAIMLDEVIPAARAVSSHGVVKLTVTAFRAPAFPSGVDVLSVQVAELQGNAADVTVGIDLPAHAQIGARTVKIAGRVVLTLPQEALRDQQLRDWGYCDEAQSLPGWAKPAVNCDPAFRNIRAGMGGVPLQYRFTVKPGSNANVVLGLCESHWAEPNQRPLVCRVEGTAAQEVDPVAKWGRHKPGALLFQARDANNDGKLEVAVHGAPGASDRNPILNAIWIFPPGKAPDLSQVVAGALSASAVCYVDVGGQNDQSLYPPGKLEYRLSLPAHGSKELVFFVACRGGSAPIPESSVWTDDTLRRAARDVWRDWPRN